MSKRHFTLTLPFTKTWPQHDITALVVTEINLFFRLEYFLPESTINFFVLRFKDRDSQLMFLGTQISSTKYFRVPQKFQASQTDKTY
jgi:hypothetical protein